MLDISDAIDLLLGGAAPERMEEINRLWGSGDERAFLSDRAGFLLEAGFGTVQVNEIALRQIWILAHALSRAAEFNVWPLHGLAVAQLPFDLKYLSAIPDQAEGNAAFDQALEAVAALATAQSVDDVPLPAEIPLPAPGVRSGGVFERVGFDLACMAAAFVFLHEMRHVLLSREEAASFEPIEEEIECDRFALTMMLERVDQYALDHREDPKAVAGKRVLGILMATLAILAITAPAERQGSQSHPAVSGRIRSILDNVPDPAPDWFWVAAAGAMAELSRSLAHRENRTFHPVPFSDYKALAYALLRQL